MASILADAKSATASVTIPEPFVPPPPIVSQHSSSEIYATIPLQTIRYQSIPIEFKAKARYPTEPQTDLNGYIYRTSPLPLGWTKYIHPDGKPYFQHQDWNAVTEANLYDSRTLMAIEDLLARIQAKWVSHPAHSLITDYEIYISLSTRKRKHRNVYYLVDHTTESILWLEDRDLRDITGYREVPPSINYDLFSRQNYFCHLQNFPCHRQLPEGLIEHLQYMLTYICTDHITSGYSATSPWSSEEAKSLFDLLQGLPVDIGAHSTTTSQTMKVQRSNANRSYRTWLGARLMVVILQSQIMHRHGLINARTDRFNSVNPPIPSIFARILGIFTFFGHITYTERFKNAWADGIASTKGWKALLGTLFIDWSDSNLLATVVLSANMAFLALQNVSSKSPAVSTSIVSTFLSVGSIVIGLHHVWRFRDKDESTAGQIGAYFKNASNLTGDLQLMSFFLSLPLSLLAWSIIFFVTSISIYAFSSLKSFTSSAALGIVILCVVSTVIFFWRVVFRA